MKRVESGGNWSLFCPDEARGLADVYGKEFAVKLRVVSISLCLISVVTRLRMVQMMSRIQSHHSGLYGPYTNRVKCQKRKTILVIMHTGYFL